MQPGELSVQLEELLVPLAVVVERLLVPQVLEVVVEQVLTVVGLIASQPKISLYESAPPPPDVHP